MRVKWLNERVWAALSALVVGLIAGVGCYDSSEGIGGDSHFLRPCEQQAQCDDLGASYACVAGFCRGAGDEQAASTDDGRAGDPPGASGANGSSNASGTPNGASTGALDDATPLVMLLVDTSGSLERMADCACETPGCEECLPDCSRGDRNRFTNMLEVLTGTFDDFACETIPREEGADFSYDLGYYLPFNRPSGQQRDDGLLDAYRDRLRFGLATFDGSDSWVGAAPLVSMANYDFDASAGMMGLWSYTPQRQVADFAAVSDAEPGLFRYPNCDSAFFMDTGIRSVSATEGALQIATNPAEAGATNATIQNELLAVRPYGGTPIAAALDDLYYLFAQDAVMQSERARSAPRHVILITDGFPDDDYRSFGCDCASKGDLNDAERCGGEDPSIMRCPYPTPEDAARALRCGHDSTRCAGPVTQVHVIGFADVDPTVTTRLDAIAIQGGGQGAHHALDALGLRREIDNVLAEIAQ